ncbi:creatininase family protein [Fodinisporobacter ferrooxydans]
MYHLSDMTWPEVKQALETVKIAIIPVGAHEQHGPHLTESCDDVLADKFSRKLGERLYPHVLVTPSISIGVSIHHIHFPGTLTFRPETLIAVIRDMVWSLKQHGIQKFLLVNSHGGNQSTLSVACTTLTHELGIEIYLAKTTASAKKAIQEHVKSTLFGHSCEREVSEAYYLAPQLIREDQLAPGDIQEGKWKLLRPGNAVQGTYFYDEMTANGCIGDATKASYDAGQAIVEEALGNIVAAVSQLLNFNEN